MSDLIRRQDAIELIHTLYPSAPIMPMNRKRWKEKYKPYIEAEKALEHLPSAQPDIIRCGECRHLHDNDCPVVGWGRDDDDYCAWAERDKDG